MYIVVILKIYFYESLKRLYEMFYEYKTIIEIENNTIVTQNKFVPE